MGDIIFSEGDIGTDMYIIQSGTVELLKAIGSETRVLATLEKGDFFGEMSVLEDVPRIGVGAGEDRRRAGAGSTARRSTRC